MQEQTRAYLPPHPSVKQVAVWYGVDIKTVRRWIAADRLTAQVPNLGRPIGGAA